MQQLPPVLSVVLPAIARALVLLFASNCKSLVLLVTAVAASLVLLTAAGLVLLLLAIVMKKIKGKGEG
jgi:hypothetical protein